MQYFQYCNDCKLESISETDRELKCNRIGTDGYGQPIKFTECKCGSINNGYLYLDYYTMQGQEIDDEFLEYLKHRILYYI